MSTKRGTISQGCKACGFHGPLEFNHKLNTFILKNPPNINPAVQGSSLTEGKRTKRSKKANGDTANGEVQGDQEGEDAPADATLNNDNVRISKALLFQTSNSSNLGCR